MRKNKNKNKIINGKFIYVDIHCKLTKIQVLLSKLAGFERR